MIRFRRIWQQSCVSFVMKEREKKRMRQDGERRVHPAHGAVTGQNDGMAN